ncbi:hypothetical protein NIES80_13740 [Dolichospermum planctonicum]|uniref:Uncharacterized protein n=1 Tax=Dolichospermum planctonicum TaxID=136072 RepID=A0A480A9M0_9CYAN|nr:hypothetical protein NIES80_13740 [Dolichospermum planctonicum]
MTFDLFFDLFLEVTHGKFIFPFFQQLIFSENHTHKIILN